MEVKALKSSILSNMIPKFLVFIEKEPALAGMYVKSISNTLGIKAKHLFSFDEFISEISSKYEDSIYIIHDDESIVNSDEKVSYIQSCGEYVYLSYDSEQKDSSLWKKDKNFFVIFNKMDEYTLTLYAQKILKEHSISVEQDKIVELAKRCNCNLGIFLNEVDKIVSLGESDSNLLVDYMMRCGFSDYRQVDMFSFINRFLSGDKKVSADLCKLSESSATVLYNTYNLARARFLSTRDNKYLKIMKSCYRLFCGVVDGSVSESYAVKYMIMDGI